MASARGLRLLVVMAGGGRVSAPYTCRRCRTGAELQPRDPAKWQCLRRQLEARRHVRRCGFRFRRDPPSCLQRLEADLIQLIFPSWKKKKKTLRAS